MAKVRINKYISQCGYTSRRKADELVKDGKVSVNGKIIDEPGFLVDEDEDCVKIENKLLSQKANNLYYVLNKPLGYLSSNSDPHNALLARDLIRYKGHLFSVGRLDSDTEGLLIYTNDGDFANIMTHPSYEISKKYEVLIDGFLDDETKGKIEKGLKIEDYITKECKIDIKKRTKKSSRLTIVISEGKNRQIRKMFEEVGFSVIALRRLTHGKITLDGVAEGKYREFSREELEYVQFIKNKYWRW